MFRTMVKTIGLVRRLRQQDVRTYVQGYLDDALASRGYVRRPSGVLASLPMLGAFGAGVAVGTGIGVVVAPASGAETRAKLRDKLDELVEAARRSTARTAPRESVIITDDPDITHGHPLDEH